MAIYVPAGRRRRRLYVVGAAALVVGLVVGLVIGRATSDSLDDQVSSAQDRGRAVSSQLRVVAVHQEADTASAAAANAGQSAQFALNRARTQLASACRKAPWIPASRCQELDRTLGGLATRAPTDSALPDFGQAVEAAASDVDAAFGVTDSPAVG
jgi:hypothetical protein